MSLCHIAHRHDWKDAVREGEYRVSTRGATLDDIGFIHASRRDQVAAVAEFLYADDSEELCVLVIDEAAVRASGTPVIDENGGDGQLYPHVYGPIRPRWVTEILPAEFGSDGAFHVGRGSLEGPTEPEPSLVELEPDHTADNPGQ